MGDEDLLGLGFRRWNDEGDGIQQECWYRILPDGQVDILAKGHRVVVPVESVPLLPEGIARVILAAMLESPKTHTDLGADERLPVATLIDASSLQENSAN